MFYFNVKQSSSFRTDSTKRLDAKLTNLSLTLFSQSDKTFDCYGQLQCKLLQLALCTTLVQDLGEGDCTELLIINKIHPSSNLCIFSRLCKALAILSIIRLKTFLISRLGRWNPTIMIRCFTISFTKPFSDVALHMFDITRQLQSFTDSRYLYIRKKGEKVREF